MKHYPPESSRPNHQKSLVTDLVVVGGGMAGTCCAITAARAGIKVVLIQDRPVLGGNASSEVRLWILGATSHMGNNNRWAREGGVIDEILVENTYRNPEGNTLILDTILLEKIYEEPNITLLLNTSVFETIKSSPNKVSVVRAFCSQNSTLYEVQAALFCDASGDGIVGFQSGAAFRMGAESAEEFDEPFAPSKAYGELLGHSLYFMSKDLGHPVQFTPPSYALKDIKKIPHYRRFNVKEHGCWLWWIEYGGRLDTVHETETIKWELWKVVYGVWDYIKNSGNFPEAENLTLEWVGQIPGKRESRRFEGHYMLKQSDIVNQVKFYDAVAHGGWAIDLHPADGVFSDKESCNQWHSKGIYEIPYRCMISRNIENLFLAGRIISASHVAFGSTRVMATCAHAAQAVGMAAALVLQNRWSPTDLVDKEKIKLLQQSLLTVGQFIPHRKLQISSLLQKANIKASSELNLTQLPFDGQWFQLQYGTAQLLPLSLGRVPRFIVEVDSHDATELLISLRCSEKVFNFTPDIVLEEKWIHLQPGRQTVEIVFEFNLTSPGYVFLCFQKNDSVAIRCSQNYVTGITSVYNKQNVAVSNYGRQDPDPKLGFEAFEFWVPLRRPASQNIAMHISPGLNVFQVENLVNGIMRPYIKANAWVADLKDDQPVLTFEWERVQLIHGLVFSFDPDWDYAMESSLLGHDERIMPFVVRSYRIYDANLVLIYERKNNHQTRNIIDFDTPIKTRKITIEIDHPSPQVPASIFGVDVY